MKNFLDNLRNSPPELLIFDDLCAGAELTTQTLCAAFREGPSRFLLWVFAVCWTFFF